MLTIGLSACGAAPTAAPNKDDMTDPLAITVSVTGDNSPILMVHCVASNVSDRVVYIFDSRRMPYLIAENATLVILHGVTPPPADRELNVIEIPTTRPLAVGESIAFDVALSPLRLRDHYGDEPAAASRHGTTSVVCRIGHGVTPINKDMRANMSIGELLKWQQISSSLPGAILLP